MLLCDSVQLLHFDPAVSEVDQPRRGGATAVDAAGPMEEERVRRGKGLGLDEWNQVSAVRRKTRQNLRENRQRCPLLLGSA